MSASFPLIRLFGTEIRAHWSWVIVLALITAVFSIDLSDQAGAGWGPGMAWGTAIATALLVFLSVAIHEVAHVAVARRDGIKTQSIVLQLIGGSFVVDARPSNAGQEFRLSIAGAFASVLLTVIFGAVALFLSYGPVNIDDAPQAVQAVQFAAVMLTAFNMFMIVISLVPGYPLDGARILHAIVWRRTGNETVAQATAMRVGRIVGLSLLGTGIAVALLIDDPIAGMCMAVAGWLIVGSSRVLERRALLQSLVGGLHASDAQEADVARIPAQLTLDVYAAEYLAERAGTAGLVVRGDEQLGLIGTAQIRRIPRGRWANTHTEAAMAPMASVAVIAPETDMWVALEILEKSGLDAAVLSGSEDGPLLMTRRAAATLVREKAEARQLEMLVTNATRKGWFRGR